MGCLISNEPVPTLTTFPNTNRAEGDSRGSKSKILCK